MDKADGRVLKAADIQVEGRFDLDINESPKKNGSCKVNSIVPQVCVIEKTGRYAVLEVTCSCGIKTCVRCDYD